MRRQAVGSTIHANYMAIRPLNWDEINNNDDDDVNWADPAAPTGGRSHPGNANHNYHSEGKDDRQHATMGTSKWRQESMGWGQGT